jgi:prepilin-type N-terminal cleavage/methylation domain-containing protein
MFKNKKAFTLTEMIIVIVIIWILMAWTTIYLQWSDETRKVIEAQWCATTIWWIINNYIFYTLTSKNLKTDSGNDSPDIYSISLSNCSNWFCDSFKFFDYIFNKTSSIYEAWEYDRIYNITDTCHIENWNLKVNRAWWLSNNSIIKMNKWFSPSEKNNKNIFYIQDWESTILIWEIIMNLCLDNNCTKSKQVLKRTVDGRTQTIYISNCEFYNEDRTCKTREGCKKFSIDDPTICEEY